MRTGVATVPLDYGKCPKWLFERMKRLSRAIILTMREEFGEEEILKRLSDPIWFQSLGCVIGFDWNSSGLTTTTLGAIKESLRGLEKEVGIFICGGKGKTSRKTPQQIEGWGEILGYSQNLVEKLVYSSKIAAKVDSSALQDGFQIYHHNFIFTRQGKWAIIQQGMNIKFQKARRYHWLSEKLNNFVEEPHYGIISDKKVKALNLTSKKSNENRQISVKIVQDEPKKFLKDLTFILERKDELMRQKRLISFTEMELNNIEFHWHPVLTEKFDIKRLQKTIFSIYQKNPKDFEELLSLKGVGPKTIRALSLVAEIIYGKKPSYEDPARYSFAHGGKDGTPFPVDRETYDKTLSIIEKAIQKAKVSIKEKDDAKRRLEKYEEIFF